jgi:ADP-L-glycero-D-manno-heptose 6-epimerase
MASVVFKAFNQIRKNGKVRLFKSHKPDFKDGEQLRDFVYVKDVLDIIWFFLNNPQKNGLFNAGCGKARSFKDLVAATFEAMDIKENIEYIDMPQAIRDRYQYFTEATMEKLRKTGFDSPATTLEEGISDYVRNYLMKDYARY